MSPQSALILAVALGTLFALFAALLFRECIDYLEMHDRRVWIALLYFTSPLEGTIILLSIYFGIDTAALSVSVAAFISLLAGILVCIEIFLILFILNLPCFPDPTKKLIFIFVVAIVIGPLTAVGIWFLIQPHIPDHSRIMSVEDAGAGVLAGLVCFSGVTFIVYLIDQYYRWRKARRLQKRATATIGELDHWEDSERSPVVPVRLPSEGGDPLAQSSGGSKRVYQLCASDIASADYGGVTDGSDGKASIPGLPPREGDKKITVTVEEESGLVYNFTFGINLADCEHDSVYHTLKKYILRKSYEFNPDINITTLKKASTGEELVDSKELWSSLEEEDELIATAVSIAPPPVMRGKAHFSPEHLDDRVAARPTVWVD